MLCPDHVWRNITGTRGVSSYFILRGHSATVVHKNDVLLTVTFSFTSVFVTSLFLDAILLRRLFCYEINTRC